MRKAKFYLFEFILIFVAVAAGAWVENLREDFQRKNKERELAELLLEDIQKDIHDIKEQIKTLKNYCIGMDSLTALLYSGEPGKQNAALLLELHLDNVRPFTFQGNNDRAKIQIESGGHDMISNQHVVINMLHYWAIQKEISFNYDRYHDYWWESRKLSYQLFDSRYIHRTNGTVSPNAKLLTSDVNLFAQYANWVSNMRGLLENLYIRNLEKQSSAANDLVRLIQQEYDLEP